MITVIDLGISNIASVSRALAKLGADHIVSSDPADVARAERLILPGVGSFSAAASRLRETGLAEALSRAVIGEKKPILGICLGMQLFASHGDEGGGAEGLGFIKGRVALHRAAARGLRLPHIGWNDVTFRGFDLADDESQACFYFVHSYEFLPDESVEISYSDYGGKFAAALRKGNVYGAQFHPEKSQGAGLKLLENYCTRVVA